MDIAENKVKNVKIIYYSGTGGTKRVADCFEAELNKAGIKVNALRLTADYTDDDSPHDLLIIIYAVYACNAPQPVHKWIEKAKAAAGTPAIVISVSGGGEITPNTACRKNCIKHLEKKGYRVVYEKMLVMPSNWIVPTKEPLALMLLDVLQKKVAGIVNDITAGTERRTKPLFIDSILACIGKFEKSGAKQFGKKIKVTGDCNGCGWCSKNCNAGNIKMVANVPHFGGECILCLNCLYGCPNKALVPGIGKFIVIKDGFSIKELEKKLPYNGQVDVNALAAGYLWSGVRKYLLDNE